MKSVSSCVLCSWTRPGSTPPPTTKCPRSRPHTLPLDCCAKSRASSAPCTRIDSGVSFSSVVAESKVRARSRLAAFGLSLAFSASLSCAGGNAARPPCPSEAWVGRCKLVDLRKVEERELPLPWIVYEATYSPQANTEYPNFLPSEARLRFGTPARNEFALVGHVKQQAEVSCHAAPIAGSCLPGEVMADVAPFNPDQAQEAAAAPTRVTGCAAIDAASEQDRLSKSRAESTAISERFSFGEGSSALAPGSTSDATALAKRMNDDPSLECVGLVGQSSPGESPSLAEARARAVKRLLVSLGVDSSRLQTLSATASVYGGSGASVVPAAEQRRVSVSVLLKTAEKPEP